VPLSEGEAASDLKSYEVEVRLPKGYESKDRKVIISPDPSLFRVNSGAGREFDWGAVYYFALAAPGMKRDGLGVVGTPVPGVVSIDVQGVKNPDGSPAQLRFTLLFGLDQRAPGMTPPPEPDLGTVAEQTGFTLYLPTYLPPDVHLVSAVYRERIPGEGKAVELSYLLGPPWGGVPDRGGFTLHESKPTQPVTVTAPVQEGQTVARPQIGEAEAVLYAGTSPGQGQAWLLLAWDGENGMHFEIDSTLNIEETLSLARSLQLRPQAPIPTHVTYGEPSPGGRLLTLDHFEVDGITDEVLNPVGTPSG
jgi:hypothetical protein